MPRLVQLRLLGPLTAAAALLLDVSALQLEAAAGVPAGRQGRLSTPSPTPDLTFSYTLVESKNCYGAAATHLSVHESGT